MNAMILGALVLSAVMCACGVDAGGDEGIGQITEEVQATPEPGFSCHVDATGVFNGTMTQNGTCCGTAVGSDGQQHYTCSSCDYYKCNGGPDLSKTHVPPPPTRR